MMIKEILKQLGILILIIASIIIITYVVSDKDIYRDVYVMDITLSKEADTSKLEEETRKVLEDNSLVVKKNGVFNTSVRIVSTKEITNDGYNKFKEQVLNFIDRDGVAKEPKLIPKENVFLNMDIYLMNLLGVIIVTILCMFIMKSLTKKLGLNEE